MKFNFNDMQNFDINRSMNYIVFLSFVTQWSFLSMIINLFTMGIIRIPLFILMIIDALTMLKLENKTIKKPSFILSKIWDFIEIFTNHNNNRNNYGNYSNTNIFVRLSDTIHNTSNKIKNMFDYFNKDKLNHKKYNKERELNKFNQDIGKKIIIEYTSQNNKLKKKTFEYKDRASTFINMLESEGYKNYALYNVDPNTTSTYIILNKNKDIIDTTLNKIHLKHDDKDYKFVIEGWPKK